MVERVSWRLSQAGEFLFLAEYEVLAGLAPVAGWIGVPELFRRIHAENGGALREATLARALGFLVQRRDLRSEARGTARFVAITDRGIETVSRHHRIASDASAEFGGFPRYLAIIRAAEAGRIVSA